MIKRVYGDKTGLTSIWKVNVQVRFRSNDSNQELILPHEVHNKKTGPKSAWEIRPWVEVLLMGFMGIGMSVAVVETKLSQELKTMGRLWVETPAESGQSH